MSASASLCIPANAVEPPGSPLSALRLAAAKHAQTTRLVPRERMRRLLRGVRPTAGDLLLARVARLGQHQHIEQANGRRAKMWVGDEIVVAYGNRYAPDQYEALVPEDLDACHLVAGGGVAARVVGQHASMKAATQIEPLGLIADPTGRRLNLADWGLRPAATAVRRPPVLAVVGCSMNAGKTTTAAGAIRGLTQFGFRVGAAKVTGTGSGGDRWAMHDAGAAMVLDFTDAGHPSTFGVALPQLTQVLGLLVGHLAAHDVGAIVLELADGLFQPETAALIESEAFARLVDGVLFATDSAMGAKAGADWLRERSRPLMAISGVVTASPLGAREAEAATGLPILPLASLTAGGWWRVPGAPFRP